MNARIISRIAILGLLATVSVVPALAQDNMQGDKMSNDKMASDKMSMKSDKMSEKMATDKALMGLSKSDKSYVIAHLNKMGKADRMAMTMKMTNLSADQRRAAVMAMRSDKMGGKMHDSKMMGGKMHDGKMMGDKMAADKMQQDEMTVGKTRYMP